MGLIQKTVYIREEDLAAWNGLPNKAAFIHSALEDYNGTPERNRILEKLDPEALAYEVPEILEPRVEPIEDLKKLPIVRVSTWKACKHGYDPKMCKFAKGGKPCK